MNRPIILFLLLTLAPLGVLSCSTIVQRDAERLGAADIHRALVGNVLEPVQALPSPDSIVIAPRSELFCADGSWRLLAHRAPISGRFEVSGDQFCVAGDNERARSCRELHRDRSGQYYTRVIGGAERALAPVTIRAWTEGSCGGTN